MVSSELKGPSLPPRSSPPAVLAGPSEEVTSDSLVRHCQAEDEKSVQQTLGGFGLSDMARGAGLPGYACYPEGQRLHLTLPPTSKKGTWHPGAPAGLGVDLFIGVSEYGPFTECPKGPLVEVGSRTGDGPGPGCCGSRRPRGACDPAGPMALEVSEEMGVLSGAISRCLGGLAAQAPRVLGRGPRRGHAQGSTEHAI